MFWTELCTAESVQTGLPIDGPPGATDSLSEEKVPGNKTLTTNPVLQVIDKNQIGPYILRRRFIKKKVLRGEIGMLCKLTVISDGWTFNGRFAP